MISVATKNKKKVGRCRGKGVVVHFCAEGERNCCFFSEISYLLALLGGFYWIDMGLRVGLADVCEWEEMADVSTTAIAFASALLTIVVNATRLADSSSYSEPRA